MIFFSYISVRKFIIR